MADQTSVVLRGGTVLTLDAQHRVLPGADVLVDGRPHRRRRRRPSPCPRAPGRSTRRDGIVMPGMIDTHRHMWQTAMRGYGADWTLTQYFVWYYLESGKHFRPQDVRAGNLLAAAEAIDAGVTTCVDWSHGLQTVGHAEAAVDALRTLPGRYVLAYGNIQQGPWEWSTSADFQAFARRMLDDDRLGFQMAFDVTGDPALPREGGVRGRARARRARHHARRGVGRDQRRRHPARARGGVPRRDAASSCTPPPSPPTPTTGSRRAAARCPSPRRASRAQARATRPRGRCGPTTSRCRCPWTPACGGAVTCSRPCAPRWAPTAPASTSKPTRRARRSRIARCAPSTSSTGPPGVAPRRSGDPPTWAASSPARRPTSS